MSEYPVPAVWLPAESLCEIGGETLPPCSYPLRPDIIAKLDQQIPWTIVASRQLRDGGPLEPLQRKPGQPYLAATQLLQPSDNHRRSFVLPVVNSGNTPVLADGDPQIMWQDEFGNPYTSISYKGNCGQTISVKTGTADPRSVQFVGLQTTYALERCVKASRLLRQAGVDTEAITGAYIPTLIPFRDQLVTPQELKDSLYLDAYLENLSYNNFDLENQGKELSVQLLDRPGISDEAFALIKQAMRESAIVVTARSMLVSDRLDDLSKESAITQRRLLDRAIQLQTICGNFIPDESAEGTVYDQYLGEFLPHALGSNIAKMHNLNLAHRMLHIGNITLTGGFVDLDSVLGPAIGLEARDDAVTENDYIQDIGMYLVGMRRGGIKELYAHLGSNQLLTNHEARYTDFLRNLYLSYTKQRDFAKTEPLQKPTILRYLAHGFDPELHGIEERNFAESVYGRKLVAITIESMDHEVPIRQQDQNDLDDVLADMQFIASIFDHLADWIEQGDDCPLARFNQAFADITSPKERRIVARDISTDLSRRKNADDEHYFVNLVRKAADAYEEAATPRQEVPDASFTPERLSGHEVVMATSTDIADAVHRVANLGLNITAVHIRQRHENNDTDNYDWASDNEIDHAVIIATNLPKAALSAQLAKVHSDRIYEAARDRYREHLTAKQRQSQSSVVTGTPGRVARRNIVHSVEPLPEVGRNFIQLANGTFITYLTQSDAGWQLEIESFEATQNVEQLVVKTLSKSVSVTSTEDAPITFVSAANMFLADAPN